MILYLVVLFFLLCIILFIVNRENIKEKLDISENFSSSMDTIEEFEQSDKEVIESLDLEEAFTDFAINQCNSVINEKSVGQYNWLMGG
jgi:hypothetical protein